MRKPYVSELYWPWKSMNSYAIIRSFATLDSSPVSHFLRSRRRRRRRMGCAFRPDSVSCWWKRLSRQGSGVVSFVALRSVRPCLLLDCCIQITTHHWSQVCCCISKNNKKKPQNICTNFLPFSVKPNFTERWPVTFKSLKRKTCIFQQCITGKDLSFFRHNVILGSVY